MPLLKKRHLYLLILSVVVICGGTASYISLALFQVKDHLANDFHEVYRHTNKLELDVLKFNLSLEAFSARNDTSTFENLQEEMDLIFLRLKVVTSMISELDPESEAITLDLSSRMAGVDQILQKGAAHTFSRLAEIRAATSSILDVLAHLSHTRDKISQNSITTISAALKRQVNLISVFIVFLTLAVIASIFLYYRQASVAYELDQLKKYLENIIDALPSILAGVDDSGTVTLWNKQAEMATGLTADKAMGQNLALAIPFLSEDMETLTTVMQTGETRIERSRARHGHSRTIFEDLTICPITAGGKKAAVIRVDDVTDQIQMKQMMIQSEKMLSVGGLAAGMAHEINNPLAGMMQNADVIKSRLKNTDLAANTRVAEQIGIRMEDIRAYMEKRDIFRMIKAISDAGLRATDIVNNMLNFARKTESQISSHRPDDLINSILEIAATDYSLKKKYDFKSVTIIKEYEADLPLLICEGTQIQQVILNILTNSAQAMQMAGTAAPRITLRLYSAREAEALCIEIEDNGPGMDDDTRSKIFDPFFTTKPVGIGTGLGLSVSYFIITENHKGSMDVLSEPGQGATFLLCLPLKP